MSATYKTFSDNLRRLCPDNGKCMETNIELLGIDRRILYARPEIKYPSVASVIKICKAWGCTPNDLLEGLY